MTKDEFQQEIQEEIKQMTQEFYKKNRASDKKCTKCIHYIESYVDDFTLRNFGYGKVKVRPACGNAKSYGFVNHNPARLCNYYKVKEIYKMDEQKREELQADIDHFKETEKTRELNSFEKGIKEESERLLNEKAQLRDI